MTTSTSHKDNFIALIITSMASFVQVVVNIPAVSGVFDYAVPGHLAGRVGVGHLVIVPFGKQTVQGVVFRFVDSPSVPQVKNILEVVDEEPVLTQPQIGLAEELAESTLQPVAVPRRLRKRMACSPRLSVDSSSLSRSLLKVPR